MKIIESNIEQTEKMNEMQKDKMKQKEEERKGLDGVELDKIQI
jgi:hypothetical protein